MTPNGLRCRAPRAVAFGLLGVFASLSSPVASAETASWDPVRRRAGSWLVAQQRPNGAFGSDTQPVDQVAEAVAALAAAGALPAPTRERALARIREAGPARAAENAGHAARIALGLVAVGADPRSFDGFDYVAAIRDRYNPVLATHGGNLYADALAGLGRIAAGERLPSEFLSRLEAARCANGGYAFSDRCGRQPDADTTALVVSVLSLAGRPVDAPAIADALGWLRALQHASGAFPLEDGFPSNANSTGLVVTMLDTLGIDPARWTRDADPRAALARFATSSGALTFTAGTGPNLWATVQGLPAFTGSGFPLRAAAASPQPATTSTTPPTRPPAAVRGDARPSTSSTPNGAPTSEASTIVAVPPAASGVDPGVATAGATRPAAETWWPAALAAFALLLAAGTLGSRGFR